MAGKHDFTKKDLVASFDKNIGKPLGEIDTKGLFDSIQKRKISKMTGIAGMIVEESILGYPADNKQRPDITVDGVKTEVKTTGIRRSVKDKNVFEAKEPMSITAVSPKTIGHETFVNSHFWAKLEHLLFVYYLYDANKKVEALDYANFPLKGYELFQFSDEQQKVLEHDWQLVHDFIVNIQKQFQEPDTQYPRLSSELRSQLMFIDTAPKWPHSPRFRLKRSLVSAIVQQYFSRKKLENLSTSITSFVELDRILATVAKQYSGKTVRQLLSELKIQTKLNSNDDVSKSIGETIIAHMFGAKSKKLKNIAIFKEMGVVPKTVILTSKGGRTEDFKISGLDLPSWPNESDVFEESALYSFFSQTQILFIIFQEPTTHSKLIDNQFIGFKRMHFSDEFIYSYVQKLWVNTRELITSHNLKNVVVRDKNQKPKITPKTGIVSVAPNFMKSSDNPVFIRGTGNDASKKSVVINGIHMYVQDTWVKGTTIVKLLNSIPFIR